MQSYCRRPSQGRLSRLGAPDIPATEGNSQPRQPKTHLTRPTVHHCVCTQKAQMDNRSYRLLKLAGQNQTEFQFFSLHFANTPISNQHNVAFSLPLAMLSCVKRQRCLVQSYLFLILTFMSSLSSRYTDYFISTQGKCHRVP